MSAQSTVIWENSHRLDMSAPSVHSKWSFKTQLPKTGENFSDFQESRTVCCRENQQCLKSQAFLSQQRQYPSAGSEKDIQRTVDVGVGLCKFNIHYSRGISFFFFFVKASKWYVLGRWLIYTTSFHLWRVGDWLRSSVNIFKSLLTRLAWKDRFVFSLLWRYSWSHHWVRPTASNLADSKCRCHCSVALMGSARGGWMEPPGSV